MFELPFLIAMIAMAAGAIHDANKEMQAKAAAVTVGSNPQSFTGQRYLVQPPVSATRQPANNPAVQGGVDYSQWQRIPSLPESGVVGYLQSYPPQLGEGGRLDYLDIQIIGTKEGCQRIAEALNYVFADAEARSFVQGCVHTIFCPHLEHSSPERRLDGIAWPFYDHGGRSEYYGMIAVDPFSSDVIQRAGVVFHEALHHYPQYDDHSVIYPMQEAFVRRLTLPPLKKGDSKKMLRNGINAASPRLLQFKKINPSRGGQMPATHSDPKAIVITFSSNIPSSIPISRN